MLIIIRDLLETSRFLAKIYAIENKSVIAIGTEEWAIPGGFKSEGESHDIIENKGSRLRHFVSGHDVIENK